MLPLPGGMGASETLFLRLFESVFGAALVLPGMVLSRGISYYVELFLCAVLTIIGHFYFGRRREKNEEKLSEGA